jgi:hypothetical protein
MQVDLFDVLKASDILTDLGSSYGESVASVSSTASPGDVFENGTVSGPWTNAINAIWTCLADSQDNCNDTGRTLVHYVNSVCATDEQAAQDLATEVSEYLDAAGNSGVDADVPNLDPNNPSAGVPVPDPGPADRP